MFGRCPLRNVDHPDCKKGLVRRKKPDSFVRTVIAAERSMSRGLGARAQHAPSSGLGLLVAIGFSFAVWLAVAMWLLR